MVDMDTVVIAPPCERSFRCYWYWSELEASIHGSYREGHSSITHPYQPGRAEKPIGAATTTCTGRVLVVLAS